MPVRHDLAGLAAQLRLKFFAEAGDDIGLVISSDTANKAYLSGYHSMTHDVAPFYESAVLATRESAALVVGSADAGPALEVIGDPALIYRYGTFYFESAQGHSPADYNTPGATGFTEALAQAVRALAPKMAKIGIDGTNGPSLQNLVSSLGLACPLTDATEALRQSRATKLDGEIDRIRHATVLVENGFRAVLAGTQPGMTERDVAALITHEMALGGGVPRFVSVTSGERSALADAYPTLRKLERGDLIRLDAGCTVDGYFSDMARTIALGEPAPLQHRRYEALAIGLEELLKTVRAGLPANTLFTTAVETVRQNGIPAYKRHHCGHGIGLKSTEHPLIAPQSHANLQSGMCLCVETPFYELGWGGMMVEDTILVTDAGYQPITIIPRELFVL